MLECADGTLYTGITTDVKRRLEEHSAGKGAKYTRGRGPLKLLASRIMPNRSAALRLEAHVKKQKASEKKLSLLVAEV